MALPILVTVITYLIVSPYSATSLCLFPDAFVILLDFVAVNSTFDFAITFASSLASDVFSLLLLSI